MLGLSGMGEKKDEALIWQPECCIFSAMVVMAQAGIWKAATLTATRKVAKRMGTVNCMVFLVSALSGLYG